jgi:hypothetical protein
VLRTQLLVFFEFSGCNYEESELYSDNFLSPTFRYEQFGKSTKAENKYYKRSTKDGLVLRATLEAITRMG